MDTDRRSAILRSRLVFFVVIRWSQQPNPLALNTFNMPNSEVFTECFPNCRAPFFSIPANPAPTQGYTSVQEDIAYRPTQQSFVYEVEDLVREALKREIR